jgi:NAD(P)-dependent dehydrogenase (short-subunit alcohol dehydrogenase family)
MSTILEKFNLKDRVAVVTGGVGLLGAEFCRSLAEAGAAVAVVDLAKYLRVSGYALLPIPGN